MNKLLILTPMPNLSGETMKLQSNYLLQTNSAVATKRNSEMTSYLNNGYDVMNCLLNLKNSYPIV